MNLALRLLPLVACCAGIYGVAAAGFGHPEARSLAGKLGEKLGR